MITPWQHPPALAHRFLASFFIKGSPSPLDVRFARVSGLGREMHVEALREGGNNLGAVNLAQRVTHGSLVLERGVTTLTPLTELFERALGQFTCTYLNGKR